MFRFGKRNFSLRESPSKLNSSSPRARLQTGSPSKRLRLCESPQVLSSTLLSETKPVELASFQPFQFDLIQDVQDVASKVVRNIEEKALNEDVKSSLCQERPTSKVQVETPPPTPDVKTSSKFEIESEHKTRLVSRCEELDKLIEAKMREIMVSQAELQSLRVSKFRYNDHLVMITRGQNDIRDNLNQVYYPGEDLANKFEPLLKSLSERHKSKAEQQTLELNAHLAQTKNAMIKKAEDLTHEIEIQQRILLHKEHFSREPDSKEIHSNETVSEDVDLKKSDENREAADEGDNDDCVILEPAASDSNVGHEEVITENSLENSDAKDDNDDTDVEDVDVEETRSFTPCQAQRPE